MNQQGLADLDELVLACRHGKAQSHIAEAVACYKAGAFRQCIVATWIAVVYDFIDKLQELDLAGDKKAKQLLEDIEKVWASRDPKRSLEFEKGILDSAKDEFELLTPLEHLDLTRLRDDRHRCAHPSMNRLGEVYEPSAELARNHLRNAVSHLLRHAPVQGKAALTRLEGEIASEYFPETTDMALRYFTSGPLARPRESLVRNLLVVLMKGFLLGENDEKGQRRLAAATNAVCQMQRIPAQSTLAEMLSEIMRRVSDANLSKAIDFLSAVQDTWQYLAEDLQTRLQAYVESMPDERLVPSLLSALDVAALKEIAVERLVSVTVEQLIDLFRADVGGVRKELAGQAVYLYRRASSFQAANTIGIGLLMPYARYYDAKRVAELIEISSANSQVHDSFEMPNVLRCLRSAARMPHEQFDELLTQFGLEGKVASFGQPEEELPF